VLVATGARKRLVVARLLAGSISTALPASLLHLHAGAEMWVDAAAAGGSRRRSS
jgi:6-phosphogluconolactonase/glucosamine-6-phosphate isomerase/deaminase